VAVGSVALAMITVAVLPIKRFDRAKQRLGAGLDPDARQTLAEAMVRDVLAALAEVRSLHRLVVVTGEPRARILARARDAMIVGDDPERGQSAAAVAGIRAAIELGAERVLLVPGDCPALDAEEVDGLLSADEDSPAVTVVPDRHGTGTNALLLAPPDVIEPAFGEGSYDRHVGAARAAGARLAAAHVPSLAIDVDTPADLDALRGADPRAATAGVLAALADPAARAVQHP
jgi:2-phospho-L-lactate guanylyltransferase